MNGARNSENVLEAMMVSFVIPLAGAVVTANNSQKYDLVMG